MDRRRRHFLQLTAGALALPALARVAAAQAWPARPVHLIVGFAPGGGTDITARMIAGWLSERLGQQFVVENRPGAGTNLATEAVVRAPADGYTLLLAGLPNASNVALYGDLKFNFMRDIAPIGGIARDFFLVAVNPTLPVKTLPEFIAYARANPGKVNMASAGVGSGNHIFGELFKSMAGVNLVHVPYRGAGPAMVDLLGGQMHVMFAPLSITVGHVGTGRLRALAVMTAHRLPQLPDVPAVAEVVPGYEASFWAGLGAPRNTPAEIVNRLNREVNAALADPTIKARLDAHGAEGMPGSPADFARLIADETERWGRVIRAAGIKAE
jgi:tripartite-type tricarboxylate transporter receptor subunit TctC